MENLSVDQEELIEGSTLLVRVADLLGDGSISRPLFDTRVVINAPTASGETLCSVHASLMHSQALSSFLYDVP